MWITLLSQALACGGLFCSAPTLPVDQTGERIVFAIDEEAGKVEMHTQIAYAGPAESFAWLVPLPTVPELFVSADELFTFLDRNTAPIFQLQQICECCNRADSDDTDGAPGADSGGPGGEPGVVVIDSALVGPYESVTLQATSTEVLLEWLNNNAYYIPDDVGPFLEPYVAAGSYVVALRLQKDRDIGDLVPLGLRYPGDTPTIPLTMTAVAATPDMALIPWVLGSGRAVPENYLHVVINELAIDWWTAGSNYSAVVGRAADEAGGQAFATDFAGPTTGLRDQLVWPGRFERRTLLHASTVRGLWGEILSQGFIIDDRLTAIMRSFFPDSDAVLADGGGGDTGWSGQRDYVCDEPEELGCEPVEVGPVVLRLISDIIEPLEHANELFNRFPYITRFTSSASPDEMTVDPRFAINASLPEVPQTRTATWSFGDCEGNGFTTLQLVDGTTVDIPQTEAPADYLARVGMPAAARIESLGRSGDPVVITDNDPVIDGAIDDLPQAPADPGNAAADDEKGTCGCASGPAGPSTALLLSLLALRRRRA